jgi:hypothetical protein
MSEEADGRAAVSRSAAGMNEETDGRAAEKRQQRPERSR